MCEFEKDRINEGNVKQMQSLLAEQASLASKNELRAIKCERDVASMKFAEYMQQHIGEEYEGFVTSVYPFGLFVQLPNTIEGFIRLENMKNDYYTYNEKSNELIGQKTGQRFSLGVKLKIKVLSANKETRKIEFSMLSYLKK
jgi:ribonuclease R